MTEVVNEVVEIYYYYNDKGQKCYTPNAQFAEIQASKYETYSVYVEKN